MRKRIKIYIDFDGTICGQADWIGWYESTKSLFKTGLQMSIPKRCWNILTARPRIDRMFIRMACNKYKVYPKEIITSPTWFFHFNNYEDIANWKSSILSKSLDELFVDKVIYVDTDHRLMSKMIKQKDIILCHPDVLDTIIKEVDTD